MSSPSSSARQDAPFDVKAFSSQLFAPVLAATKTSNELPKAGNDYEFYCSYPGFRQHMHQSQSRLQSLLVRMLNYDKHNRVNAKKRVDDDTLFDALVESLDVTLEKVDNVLDTLNAAASASPAGSGSASRSAGAGDLVDRAQMTSIGSSPAQGKQASSSNSSPMASPTVVSKTSIKGKTGGRSEFHLLHAKNIARPQLSFADTIDNSNGPFIPKVPLSDAYLSRLSPKQKQYWQHSEQLRREQQDNPLSNIQQNFNPPVAVENVPSFPHPFERELLAFEPPETQLTHRPEQLYGTLEETPYTYVDTEDKLAELINILSSVPEFAVDLEHHSYRSLQGFVCLMQISTRKEDFLVDTLALRSRLHLLRPVFLNSAILKVFHGADMDVVWLQRDFGIYIVNMFDTGQAARVLELGSYALSHLLRFYCNVTADKKYQLADWRMRPLAEEMVHYAREDTHYLLYIYDRLRNELCTRSNETGNLLKIVYQRSRDVCLKQYEKPLFDPAVSPNELLSKHTRPLGRQQQQVFKAVFAWRDRIARDEDESFGYVLPNHMLFHIAESTPTESAGVLACCIPVPPLVRMHVTDLVQIIRLAREEAEAKEMEQLKQQQRQQQQQQQPPKAVQQSSPASAARDSTPAKSSSTTLAGQKDVSSLLFPVPAISLSARHTNLLQSTHSRLGSAIASKLHSTASQSSSAVAKISASFALPFLQGLPVARSKRTASEMAEDDEGADAEVPKADGDSSESEGDTDGQRVEASKVDSGDNGDSSDSSDSVVAVHPPSPKQQQTPSGQAVVKRVKTDAPVSSNPKSKQAAKPKDKSGGNAANAIDLTQITSFDYKAVDVQAMFTGSPAAMPARKGKGDSGSAIAALSDSMKVVEPEFKKAGKSGVRSRSGEKSLTSSVSKGFQKPASGAPVTSWPSK